MCVERSIHRVHNRGPYSGTALASWVLLIQKCVCVTVLGLPLGAPHGHMGPVHSSLCNTIKQKNPLVPANPRAHAQKVLMIFTIIPTCWVRLNTGHGVSILTSSSSFCASIRFLYISLGSRKRTLPRCAPRSPPWSADTMLRCTHFLRLT